MSKVGFSISWIHENVALFLWSSVMLQYTPIVKNGKTRNTLYRKSRKFDRKNTWQIEQNMYLTNLNLFDDVLLQRPVLIILAHNIRQRLS